jgi:uncharacterized membrane protein YhhN
MKKIIPYLFFTLLLIEIIGEVMIESIGPNLIYATKTLLMPLLIVYYYLNVKGTFQKFDQIIIAALFFSWWGDNFLMPNYNNISLPFHFLAGLGSFLIAHLMYIPAFLKSESSEKGFLIKQPWFALPIILLVIGLLSFLISQNHPAFEPMKIPVIVYSTVILLMVLSAINRKDKVRNDSFNFILVGAIMFMISDSFIALSRFSDLFEGNVNLVRILIMSLYATGQFLITKGAIYKYNRN